MTGTTPNGDAATSERSDAAAEPLDAAAERARAEDFRNKYLLASAEVENTRKWMQRRSDDATQASRKKLLLKFLPVLDNLERALAYEDSQDLRNGLAATLRGFETALQSEGVAPIETTGRRFDPSRAQAIETRPAEGVEDETVISEAQRGFVIGDDVLRPALVVVAKRP
ncbi:MAG: grpE [Candidatus Eremiobacteraeota bacterium]|nr:grpE [Candidatus Eremiobacteraeota bacterium]